jgi:hypothetical protein
MTAKWYQKQITKEELYSYAERSVTFKRTHVCFGDGVCFVKGIEHGDWLHVASDCWLPMYSKSDELFLEKSHLADSNIIQKLASPDGSFQIYLSSHSRRACCFNGCVIVDLDDSECFATLTASTLGRLDSFSFDAILLPYARIIIADNAVANVSVQHDYLGYPDREEWRDSISFAASLIQSNKLRALDLPDYFPGEVPLAIVAFEQLCDAIKATTSLKSLTWLRVFQNPKYEALLQKKMLDALKVNSTLTDVSFSDRVSCLPEELASLLDRKKHKVTLDSDTAAGQLEGATPTACPAALAKRLLSDKFDIHKAFFDSIGDMCFCEVCHEKRGDKLVYSRGEPRASYSLPIGFTRFGLSIQKGFAAANDVFNKWHVSYHGTVADSIEPIFKGGLALVRPGDVALGGTLMGARSGHILRPFKRLNLYTDQQEMFDPNQIFTSPSSRYASHPAYAPLFIVDHPDKPGKQVGMRFLFQCRQRPGSYSIGQETVGASSLCKVLDMHFKNTELEWYTKESHAVLLTGLLVQVRELT